MDALPIPDLPAAVLTALLAAAGLLVYVFAWRAVKHLPFLARSFARLVLAALVLGPFVLLIWMTVDGRLAELRSERPAAEEVRRERPAAEAAPPPPPPAAQAPPAAKPDFGRTGEAIDAERAAAEQRERARAAAEAATKAEEEQRKTSAEAKPAPAGGGAPGQDDGVLARRDTERTRGLEPPAAAVPPPEPPRPAPAAPSPPPPPPVAAAPAPPPPPPAPGAAPAKPRPAGEAGTEDWDVVPVFYGTDRAVEADPKRLAYGWERGRRLEIGRALVTVPRAHQVPQVERPWVVRIPYFQVKIYEEAEDPRKHFTMKEVRALSREEFLALVRERLAASARFKDQALVFVHGYNTGFDAAVYRTAQIAYDLKFDGAPFLYSWPSGGKVASYTYDRESAGQSEPHLRKFLELVVKETGAKSVSIIAHSMGNQPLLQVLKELKLQAPPGVEINQVISAAPDVDRDSFENIAKTIQGFARGMTLYAASNDRALIVSRRFHGGVPRAGDVPEQGPIVIPGLDTIDVSAASMDGLGINHSGYAENNALLNDIGLLIQTGERPPDKRIPILERIKTAAGEYWRYPGKAQ